MTGRTGLLYCENFRDKGSGRLLGQEISLGSYVESGLKGRGLYLQARRSTEGRCVSTA